MYNDQESQSSSSCDESNLTPKSVGETSTEKLTPNKISNFQPIERIPIDRLMIATASIAAQKSTNQKHKRVSTGFSVWLSDIDNEIRMCLG